MARCQWNSQPTRSRSIKIRATVDPLADWLPFHDAMMSATTRQLQQVRSNWASRANTPGLVILERTSRREG